MSNPDVSTPRIQSAAKVMKITEEALYEHLSKLGLDKGDDDFFILLEAYTTTYQDAQAIFCPSGSQSIKDALDEGKVPVARFKAGWEILKGRTRQGSNAESSTEELIRSLRSIKSFKDKELLKEYSPECSCDILEELQRRTHDRPFLVFDDENLDEELSLKMLRIARRGPTNDVHVIQTDDGPKTLRLFRPGQFPTIWFEESPVHPEIVLVDGYCRECNNSWTDISENDRIIVRVAVDVDGVDISSLAKIHELITTIRKNGDATFLLKVPVVAVRYDELKKNNRLPILRRRVTSDDNGIQDPLFVQHRQY